jgi:glycosyltransferase involved in cell wall biosynthesis
MKNVLLIGSELGKGGAERSISLLSYYLEQHHNVTLCILSGKDREKYYKTCKNVVFIDPPETKSTYGKIAAWRYRIQQLRSLKKAKNIDVSISFLEGPDYANILSKDKEKVVISIRGSKVHDKVISGAVGVLRKKFLMPWLYQKANKVVCVTEALSTEIHQHFRVDQANLRTIYNFYEVDRIRTAASEHLSSEEEKIFSKPVIVSSGRLHVAKQQDKLIRVLHKLKQKQDVRLMLLGDGELKQELITLAHRLQLTVCDWEQENDNYRDADIYFMGFQQNAFKFYNRSKMFALSSSWEGFPNALAEALICNIPVVTTDCYTGPREILNVKDLPSSAVTSAVRSPVGSLLPLLDSPTEDVTNIWAEEIQHWLSAPRPLNKDFDRLTNRFTLDKMLQQWKDVIEN